MSLLPADKPHISRDIALKIARNHGLDLSTEKVIVIGIRGYYLNSMGAPGKNDRGIYDDAVVVLTPTGIATYNFNTDPSVDRQGIATLKPGIIRYKKGTHGISWATGGYPAFRPATKDEQVPVVRDGVTVGNLKGTALNIHKGGVGTTASEGCQTLPPDQWLSFKGLVYGEMDRYGITTFPYLLITESDYPEA